LLARHLDGLGGVDHDDPGARSEFGPLFEHVVVAGDEGVVAGDEMRDKMLDIVAFRRHLAMRASSSARSFPTRYAFGSMISSIVMATTFCSSLTSAVSMPRRE
jgi:hypothetical protein